MYACRICFAVHFLFIIIITSFITLTRADDFFVASTRILLHYVLEFMSQRGEECAGVNISHKQNFQYLELYIVNLAKFVSFSSTTVFFSICLSSNLEFMFALRYQKHQDVQNTKIGKRFFGFIKFSFIELTKICSENFQIKEFI